MSSNQKGSCVGQNLCTSSDSVVSSSRTGYGTWSHKLLLNQSFPKNTNKHQFEIIQRCATGSALLNINPGSLTFHYPICFQMRLINHSCPVTCVSSLLRTECNQTRFFLDTDWQLTFRKHRILLRHLWFFPFAFLKKTCGLPSRWFVFRLCGRFDPHSFKKQHFPM